PSPSSRNPFRAGDDFRGFLVHTFATACQSARPRYGSDHLRGQRGLLLPGFQRDEPVAGYNYSSDWTPLLTGLSPARMAASLAAPAPFIAALTLSDVKGPLPGFVVITFTSRMHEPDCRDVGARWRMPS